MVTIVSHISNYFEEFNSSLTETFHRSSQSDDVSPAFYVFDFERYSDQVATLRDLRTFMIQRWHNSFFYALAYLFLIYSKGQLPFVRRLQAELSLFISSWSDLHEEQATLRVAALVSSMEHAASTVLHLRCDASAA